jgi:hypothetical protein
MFGRVHEQVVFSFGFFSHVNTGLFLFGETLSKEILLPSFLQGVIGLDCQKLPDPLPDAVPPGKMIEAHPRKLPLLFNPLSRARRVLVFEPSVGVAHGDSVEDFRDRLDSREGRSQR